MFGSRFEIESSLGQLVAGLALTLGLLLGAGCGAEYNNDIFEDDASFRAALPMAELLRVDVSGAPEGDAQGRGAGACVEGGLYNTTVNTVTVLNNVTDRALRIVDTMQNRPISQRTEESRVWGPYPLESGALIRLTVERRDVREAGELLERYIYWMDVLESPEGLVGVALWGHWDPTYTLTQGVGSLGIDYELLGAVNGNDEGTGTLSIGYDILDIRRIEAEFEERISPYQPHDTPADTSILYQEDGSGGGWLRYEVLSNLTGGDERLEQLEITSRLFADGSGRAEGWAFDGDLGLEGIYVVECWSASGCLVYYEDSNPSQAPQGNESRCVVRDVILPDGF